MRRHRRGVLFTIIVLLGLAMFSGCKEDSSRDDSEEDDKEESNLFGRSTEVLKPDANDHGNLDEVSDSGSIHVTADEAVALAYIEAVKWNEEALLWEVKTALDTSVHYNWMNNGKAYFWLVGFANPVDESMIHIWIKNGKVDSVRDLGNTRHSEVIPDLAVDKIAFHFEEAIEVMCRNGAPTGYMPYAIEYSTVKNDDGSSSVFWFVGFDVKRTDEGRELQIYKVGGSSGEFAGNEFRVFYDREEDEDKEVKGSTDRSVLEFPGADLSDRYYTLDQRVTIVKFLTFINEAKVVEAVDMMDSELIGDAAAKKMWKESFEAIQYLEIENIYAYNEEAWTDDRQYFEVQLILPEEERMIEYGWDIGSNTRWMELSKEENNQWMIRSIATGP